MEYAKYAIVFYQHFADEKKWVVQLATNVKLKAHDSLYLLVVRVPA